MEIRKIRGLEDARMYVYCTYYAPICRANGMEKASFARIVGADGGFTS